MNKAILEGIGLTKSEISVYLALLELGSSSTGKIVDKSGASSSKIYEILDRLIQKGLVSYVLKANVKYFEAAPPKRILDYIEEKKSNINQQELEVKKMIPELELKRSLAGIGSETQVFKGIKGAKTAFDDILDTMKERETFFVLSHSKLDEPFQIFLKTFHQKREKAKIKCDMIINEVAKRDFSFLQKYKTVRSKKAPSELFTPFGIIIYKDKVLITISKDQVFIQIKSKQVSEGLKSYFDYLWDQKVQTHQGMDGVKTAFYNALDLLKPNQEMLVLGIPRRKPELNKFFIEFAKERARRGIKERRIVNETAKGEPQNLPENIPLSKIKFTPELTPAAINIFGDRVIIFPETKEKLLMIIDSKEVAETFRIQFEKWWDQDVKVYKGFEDVTNRFRQNMEELNAGDEYYVLGSALQYEEKTKLENFFIDYHKKRVKKKVTVKLLSIPESYDVIYKEFTETGDPEMKFAALKKLPPEFKYPLQITLYKGNKVSLISWKEDICFEIESKTMYDGFKANFDMLWAMR